MIRITDAFLGEHGLFHAELNRIEEMLAGAPDLEWIHGAAARLASALAPHFDLEDELLFGPALERLDDPGQARELIRCDREELRRHVTAVGEATRAEGAADMLHRAIRFARDCFLREERLSYGLAERLLGEEELLRRGAVWADRRFASPEPLDRIGLPFGRCLDTAAASGSGDPPGAGGGSASL